MKPKVFALVDCNNFYCSCERLFRPDLKHRPVAVLSNNDGCIVARSQEVKDLGIKMGTPLFQVNELVKEHAIQIFSSNYTLYGDISQRVMQTLETFSPHIEIYSIDEGFLDLSGIPDLVSYGQRIKQTVYREVGIPVSVGIAPTKTLAKLANYAAKKIYPEAGVVDLTKPEEQKHLLHAIPVGEVWGIGRRHTQALKRIGISTGGQLAALPPKLARNQFSVVMERTVRELNGFSCIDLEEMTPPKKQIICSRSFGEKISDYRLLRETICEFTARAAEKLRHEKQHASSLSVFIRTSPFDQNATYFGNAATSSLEQATSNTCLLLKKATSLLDSIWEDGHRYAKAGVMLNDFSSEIELQYPLLANRTDSSKTDTLMQTLDQINRNTGKVWFGGQRPRKDWFMRQARLSPAYTTRWECLPLVT